MKEVDRNGEAMQVASLPADVREGIVLHQSSDEAGYYELQATVGGREDQHLGFISWISRLKTSHGAEDVDRRAYDLATA